MKILEGFLCLFGFGGIAILNKNQTKNLKKEAKVIADEVKGIWEMVDEEYQEEQKLKKELKDIFKRK